MTGMQTGAPRHNGLLDRISQKTAEWAGISTRRPPLEHIVES